MLLAKAEQSHDDLAYASALAAYTEINEGAVVARAKEILHGHRIQDEDSERKGIRVLRRLEKQTFSGPCSAYTGRVNAA